MIEGSLALDERMDPIHPPATLHSGPAPVASDAPAPTAPIFEFPEGLLGFPEMRHFTLESTELEGVYWMQSTECELLAFVLGDPFVLVPGFSVDIGDNELGSLRGGDPASLGLLAILTIRETESVTANLQGPVLVDFERQMGRQVVLRESDHGVAWPVELVPQES